MNPFPTFNATRSLYGGALALWLVMTAGCAIPNHPLPLHPLSANEPKPGLIVTALEDRRPPVQRQGKRPILLPLVIWNSRIGMYVTGDGAFTQPVGAAVSHGLAVALAGGRFGSTTVQDTGTPASVCAARGARYVVTGEIRDLYASQEQNDYALITPIYLSSGFRQTDPVGFARIHVRIHDCTRDTAVFEQEFESEQLVPGATLSRAAVEGLAGVLQQVRSQSR